MKLGEVSLLTNDVIRLANFYKQLLEIDNASEDEVHQVIIGEETMLAIYNDGTTKNNQNQNVCLAFTVEELSEVSLAFTSKRLLQPSKKHLHIQEGGLSKGYAI